MTGSRSRCPDLFPRLAPGVCAAFMLVLAGCTRTQDYLDIMHEQQAAYKEIAAILEKVKDQQSMAEAKAALDERFERFEAIARRARSLPPPSPEVSERLQQGRAATELLIFRVREEAARVRQLKPGGEEFMKHYLSKNESLFQAVQPSNER